MNDRDFDVIVFGATGFAGRLVAEYLQDHHPELRWAMAGRSERKLQDAVAALAKRHPDGAAIPYRVADSHDDASLNALAASTKVICTTVGPYAKYGAGLVAAAVANGTHYCDLTGEPQFVRRMIDTHHDSAVAAGVRIVHCCGFDSIPSDLGTLVLQDAAMAKDGEPCDEVEFVVLGADGGFSGGTIASLVNVLEEAADPEVRRVLRDPYSLAEGGPDTGEQMGVRYSDAAQAWTGPFVMAGINERVVRRSNQLRDYAYGRDFRYGESMRTGAGVKGQLAALGMAGGMGVFMGAMVVSPLRRVILRFLPSPGEGPSPEAIEKGWFKIRLFGKRHGQVVSSVDVVGQGDPGYGATACMLGEAAVSLACDDDLGVTGVSTPASALGQALVDRLNATKVQFTVRESS